MRRNGLDVNFARRYAGPKALKNSAKVDNVPRASEADFGVAGDKIFGVAMQPFAQAQSLATAGRPKIFDLNLLFAAIIRLLTQQPDRSG